MMAPCEAQAREISSRASTYPTASPPAPPRASGMATPIRPSSPMRATVSRGNRASRSMASAIGRTSFSAKSRATCWIRRCSSVSSRFICCSRSSLRALQLRGPRHGPRTPPAGGQPFPASGSSAAGAPIWPPHSPSRRTTVSCFRLFSCGGPDMAPALPQLADNRSLLSFFLGSLVQEVLELLGQEGGDLEEVADDAVVGDLEDRGLRVLVDGADHLRGAHAGQVLDRARDAEAEVELRRDGAAGLADLEAVRAPARVDRRARGADRGAEHLGQLLEDREVLGALETTTARHHDLGLAQLRQARRGLLPPLHELHDLGGHGHRRLLHRRARAGLRV